jgi:hypothetical protein
MGMADMTLPVEALRELRLMEQFFEPENAVMLESDLIAVHGQDDVWGAIDNGILEHRRLPFSDGRDRCICWLTARGRQMADA